MAYTRLNKLAFLAYLLATAAVLRASGRKDKFVDEKAANMTNGSHFENIDSTVPRIAATKVCTFYQGACWAVDNIKNCKTKCYWFEFWCRRCPDPKKVPSKACSRGLHKVAGGVCKYIGFTSSSLPGKVLEILKTFL